MLSIQCVLMIGKHDLTQSEMQSKAGYGCWCDRVPRPAKVMFICMIKGDEFCPDLWIVPEESNSVYEYVGDSCVILQM